MKNNGDFTPALIVKLILILVFLLTAAFVSGVVIGKNGRRNVDRTSSDEEGINEKLSVCIFNSDELRGKYLKLRDAARQKGLMDENDVINMDIVCSNNVSGSAEKPESVEKSDDTEPVQTSHETSVQEPAKPEKAEKAEKDDDPKPAQKPAENVETFHETPLQEKPKPEKAKTIDEILTEKKAEPKKGGDTKCRFSIQIASLDSAEQAAASKKQFRSLDPRVVESESKGKKLFKIRTGCFDSREAAEAELPKVRNLKKDAFIVSE
ncbi:SPOR domain-containing protein [bacterium]|nr:SPOR domain-containing protein [bacterium]